VFPGGTPSVTTTDCGWRATSPLSYWYSTSRRETRAYSAWAVTSSMARSTACSVSAASKDANVTPPRNADRTAMAIASVAARFTSAARASPTWKNFWGR